MGWRKSDLGSLPAVAGAAVAVGVVGIFLGWAYVVAFLAIELTVLLIHEIGHIAPAWMCAGRIRHIELGTGPRLGAFRVVGVPVTFRLFPVVGFTEVTGPSRSKGAQAWVLSGGVLANGLTWLAAIDMGRPASVAAERLWLFFVVSSAVAVVANALPMVGRDGIGTDGHQLIELWRMRGGAVSSSS